MGEGSAALVDWQSGMTFGTTGGSPNLNTDVVRAKLKVMQNLGLEDILITLTTTQYRLTRMLEREQGLFL